MGLIGGPVVASLVKRAKHNQRIKEQRLTSAYSIGRKSVRSNYTPTQQRIVSRLPQRYQSPLVCRGDRASIIPLRPPLFDQCSTRWCRPERRNAQPTRKSNDSAGKEKTTQQLDETARWLCGSDGRRRGSARAPVGVVARHAGEHHCKGSAHCFRSFNNGAVACLSDLRTWATVRVGIALPSGGWNELPSPSYHFGQSHLFHAQIPGYGNHRRLLIKG